jgi:hypothetical protein
VNERNPFSYSVPGPGNARASFGVESLSHYQAQPGDPAGLSWSAHDDIGRARASLARHGLEMSVQVKAPTFRPGDVLVVRFHGPGSTPYTYVRSRRDWPGDGVRKTDAEMAGLWREGKARLIARDGQHYSDLGPAVAGRGV